VATWLMQHPADAIRGPSEAPALADRASDREFDRTVAVIRRRASKFSDEEIDADIREANAEARALSPQEWAQVSAEFESILREFDARAT